MQSVLRALKRSGCGLGGLSVLVVAFAGQSPAAAADPIFLRGDANGDGQVSISDALTIRRFLFSFSGDPLPPCLEAANADDNEGVNIADFVVVLNALFYGSTPPMTPFPTAGSDPTPGTEPFSTCENDQVVPAPFTNDVIRIGEISANPGTEVAIPIYLTSTVPVEAFQLVVRYDPTVFTPLPKGAGLSVIGTAWDVGDDPGFRALRAYPTEGYFVAGKIGSVSGFFANGGQNGPRFPTIPAGIDVPLATLHGTVAPTAVPGSTIVLEPWNGPDGDGVQPPYFIRNEITSKGAARYVSFVPQLVPGAVAIIDEITFFIRGDSNRDKVVDISDPTHVLGYLFLGNEAPRCPDAADADDNGLIEITDAIAILSQLFAGEGRISAPYPSSGRDSTPDDLPECGM